MHRLRLRKYERCYQKVHGQLNENELYNSHNVKMSIIVGTLIFISIINITSECLKAINIIFLYFSFYVQL